jgi:hypothetical protein
MRKSDVPLDEIAVDRNGAPTRLIPGLTLSTTRALGILASGM